MKSVYENPSEVLSEFKKIQTQIRGILDLESNDKIAAELIRTLLKSNLHIHAYYIVAQEMSIQTNSIEANGDVRIYSQCFRNRINKILTGITSKRIDKNIEVFQKYQQEFYNIDGLEILKQSVNNDFLVFDPPYVEKNSGISTQGYDKTDSVSKYTKLSRVVSEILPEIKKASDRGVKIIFTNEFNDSLANEMIKIGFSVFKTVRKQGGSKIAYELVAVNYMASEDFAIAA